MFTLQGDWYGKFALGVESFCWELFRHRTKFNFTRGIFDGIVRLVDKKDVDTLSELFSGWSKNFLQATSTHVIDIHAQKDPQFYIFIWHINTINDQIKRNYSHHSEESPKISSNPLPEGFFLLFSCPSTMKHHLVNNSLDLGRHKSRKPNECRGWWAILHIRPASPLVMQCNRKEWVATPNFVSLFPCSGIVFVHTTRDNMVTVSYELSNAIYRRYSLCSSQRPQVLHSILNKSCLQ